MSRQKKIRLISNTGVEVVFDKKDLAKIIIPDVTITNKYYRLVFDMQKDIENQVKDFKKKIKI